MIEGRAEIRQGEVAAQQQMVIVKLKFHRYAVIEIHAVGYQPGDTFVFQRYGRPHRSAPEEAEAAGCPVVGSRTTAHHHILRHSPFMAALLHYEVIHRLEVLVKPHLVIKILDAGNACHRHIFAEPFHRQTVRQRIAAIITCIVIVYLTVVGFFIGITALTRQSERRHIVDEHLRGRTPLRAPAEIESLFRAGACIVVMVAVETVAECHRPHESHIKIASHLLIGAYGHPRLRAGGYPAHHTVAPVMHGPHGIYVHLTAHGVAAIESALRAADHLDALYVEEVGVVIVLIKDRHIVYIQSHNGLVHTAAEAAHIDARGHAAAIIGYIEVGSNLAHCLEGAHAPSLGLLQSEGGGSIRKKAQVGTLLDRCNGNIVELPYIGICIKFFPGYWKHCKRHAQRNAFKSLFHCKKML